MNCFSLIYDLLLRLSIVKLMDSLSSYMEPDNVLELVKRMELFPRLFRRHIEEQILEIVPIPDDWFSQQKALILGDIPFDDYLSQHHLSDKDFYINTCLPEALLRYARQRFGPSLEETFLLSDGARDEVIYSLLRVKDFGLARELWIRLEEGEVTFAEAAQNFSEGPESHRKGVMGPMPIGQLQPQELITCLRNLRHGQIKPPFQIGDWWVLLRLEQLTPARFDTAMKKQLLLEALDNFLNLRVDLMMSNQPLEPLHYDPQP